MSDNNPLSGRTIVITGAASGLGKVWAEGFLGEGARVVAADINDEGLAPLRKAGAMTLRADVSKAEDVASIIDLAVQETKRIDVLFNNAGLGFGVRVEDMNEGQFEQHVAVHLFGTMHGMRLAIPHMRRQNFGRIVNTISRAAEVGQPGTSAYAAAKAAIWAASRVTAKEVADANILVNMLIPGPTNTAIWGRDRPDLQTPEVTFGTARMLATLSTGGPSGKVFWDETEYLMFNDQR